jgi:hypothetical protein
MAINPAPVAFFLTARQNSETDREGAPMRTAVVWAGCALALAGCAQNASEIAATYISPLQYQSYSCNQIAQEATRVSVRVAQLTGTQNQRASGDAAAMVVSAIIFWPALFFIRGDDENAAELARLKGEFEALQQASIQKNCNIRFENAPA